MVDVFERHAVRRGGRTGPIDPAVARPRSALFDSLRGAAVLLMVLDHLLIQLDADSFLRVGSPLSITRLSLPLFMLAASAVWRPDPLRLRWKLFVTAFVEAFLCALLGMPWPGIVLLLFVMFRLLDVVSHSFDFDLDAWAYPVAVLGLVQALYVPVSWNGYQPGLVVAWFMLGRLAWFYGSLSWFPRWRVLTAVGRHPLLWYIGHLLALVGLVAAGVL